MKKYLVLRIGIMVIGASSLTQISAARSKPVLTVYTYDAFQSKWGPGPKLKEQFETTCACELKFIPAADGAALLSKLKIEGKQTKADVVVGLDSTMTKDAKSTDLFQTTKPNTNWFIPVPIEDLDTFQPVDFGWYAFMYNTRTFAAKFKDVHPPSSLDQLLSSPLLAKQIIIQDPRSSSVGLGLLLWLHARFGEHAEKAMKDLHKQTLLVGRGWSDSYSKFTKGEALVVLSYSTSEAYHREEEKTDQFRAMAFGDGQYLQVEVAGIIRHSKNATLAKTFLDFLATPKAQATIARGNWMYPVIALGNDLPKSYSDIKKPEKTLYLPSSVVSKNRKQWTDEWVQLFSSK